MAADYGHASGTSVIVATIVTTVLATFAILARLFTRRIIVRNLGWDDLLAVLALAISILLTITVGREVQHGLARHDGDINPTDMVATMKAVWASMFLYYLGIAIIKESILMQYLRIFPQTSFRIVCYTLMALVFAHGVWSVLSAIFMCRPIDYYWMSHGSADSGGSCFDKMTVGFVNTGVNIFTDLAICILPLPALYSIAMPKRVKTALMVLFGLGGLVCMISILRLIYLYLALSAADTAYNSPLLAIWSSVGLNTALFCSCLPTLKACLTRLFPRRVVQLLTSAQTPRRRWSDDSYIDDAETLDGLSMPKQAHLSARSSSEKIAVASLRNVEEGRGGSDEKFRHDSLADVKCEIGRGSRHFDPDTIESGMSRYEQKRRTPPSQAIQVVTVIQQDVERTVEKRERKGFACGPYSAQQWIKDMVNVEGEG